MWPAIAALLISPVASFEKLEGDSAVFANVEEVNITFFAPAVVQTNPSEEYSFTTLPHMTRAVSNPCFADAPSNCG